MTFKKRCHNIGPTYLGVGRDSQQIHKVRWNTLLTRINVRLTSMSRSKALYVLRVVLWGGGVETEWLWDTRFSRQ